MILLLDLALLFAAFLSANIALAWGELGSYNVHGDKSGLAGMMGMLLFMLLRWGVLAAALLVAVRRGGFPELPGGRGLQSAIVIAAHTALGIISYQGMEWITRAIQNGDVAPLRFAWMFAFLIPIPVLLAAFWGLHRNWIPKHWILSAIAVVLLICGHIGGWQAGFRR